ncbi:30S ribosomal protein S9 [Candidatus Woesearchaeota archaeon]|jgi:small subunit ribosomal protein S9|nr:30S ribosomal protein S9 [Candidatus Woesearchaeota archaeon]
MKIISSGKRKRAVARGVFVEGNGEVKINNQDYKTLNYLDRLKIEEPLRIAKEVLENLSFKADISVRGGGARGQIEAARIALARGIIKFTKSKELSKEYLNYDRGMLVADVRRKEPRKPGDSKARAKRQKSYR